MGIFNEKQIEYIKDLDEPRLIEYLSKRSLEELKLIKQDIKSYIKNKNLSPKEKDDYLTTISYIDAKINNLSTKIDEEWIDTSTFKPLTIDDIIKILELTIKKDNNTKVITFFAMLSTYTKDSQFNVSFNAPSSSGKSYIPTEIATLFPQEDIETLGYASASSFFHIGDFNKRTNELIVNLEKKILIFLDQPHTLLLERLRPLFSHDKKEIKLKITDKNQKYGLRTKNILIRGYPSVIFCSASMHLDEQESTRFILLSPEISQEKISEAIDEKLKKESNINDYQISLELNEERQQLKRRILAIKQEEISDIIIKEKELELIKKLFFEKIKILKPRHTRDIGRICSLIKSHALLNLWFREREGSNLIVNEEDVRETFKLWDSIAISQELNIPPYLYNFYNEVILPAFKEKNSGIDGGVINSGEDGGVTGLTRQEIIKAHYKVYGRYLSDWQLRKEILPVLENTGLIIQEPDINDKRKMLIYPTNLSDNNNLSVEEKNSNEEDEIELF
jgi:hypothetical protein